MGEQRPMFRFRLPWMISSAPAPPPVAAQRPQQAPLTPSQPPTKSEPTVNPTMPARRPFRLPGMAPAQPPPPIQPPVERQSEPITITSTPRVLPQASPTRSPKVSAAQDPHSKAEIPPEIKSQTENSFQPAPPSPSRTHSPPTQLPSSPPSPQLSATSHPPSPGHIPSQERDTSQLPSPKSPKSDPRPTTPRPTSSKASDASQTSSPSRTTSKVRDASQPSSPDRSHFQKSSQAETFQQPHSPPQFQSSGQKSPVTSSPSLTATNVQQTTPQSPPRAETLSSTFQPQTNIEPNVNPTTPVQRPFRFTGIAPAQPPTPIQPTVQSQSNPITITSGPTLPPQAPPLWSPKISAAKDRLPQPEVSVDSKSQSQNSSKPTSPSKTHFQATSQLPSPSSTSAQSSATSQQPSQPSATPQPPSPWRITSQERDTTGLPSSKSSPQPSSPWRESSKARDGSQPSSPDRHQFQKSSQAETVQQPPSPSKLDFQPPKKASPVTSSPSLTATNVQQTERTVTRLPSPSTTSNHIKIPQPSASFDKPASPVSVKASAAVSQPQSLEDQSKTKITPSVTFKSPTKATVQPTNNVAKPPKRDIEMVPETSELASHNKEKLKISSQAEHSQLKNQHLVHGKEAKIPKASSLDEKKYKTKTSQQTDNKSTVSESGEKLVTPNEDRVPFQKELRNNISMFVNKMGIAHAENSKNEQVASVIALVGKNKGAVMKLGSEPANGEGSFKTHRANKTEPVEGTKENERNGSAKRRSSNNKLDQENQIQKTFVNNNVQDINNSLLMNSSITERNPGVHLALYYDPTEPIMSYDRKGSSEARKGKSRLPLPKAYI